MQHFKHLSQDAIAGLSGAVAGAPQAMGFALIAGISPIYGLYTAVVSTIVAALTGSSTYMTVGPTNALALVTFSTLTHFDEGSEVERLFVLTLLVGVFMLVFGLLRLGTLVRFVSNAVMTGFITGAGLLIVFGQVRHLNGYNPEGSTALLRFFDWVLHLHRTQPETLVISAGAIAAILLVQQTRFKTWATLIAIVGATVAVKLLNWDAVALVQSISSVPRGLPAPVLPDVTLAIDLAPAALAMAVLGAVQSAALTNSIPEPDGSTSDTTRDFIGMGLGNIVGAVFQGMPACGSLSRTAVNVEAGAHSRLSNVMAGGFVALFLLALGPLVEQVTLAALAAQLIVAAIRLISPAQVMLVWRVNPAARTAMTATFASTLVLPLEFSIYIGVVLSLGMYVYTAADSIHIERLVPLPEGRYKVEPIPRTLPDNAVTIVSVTGHLFFAAVNRLEAALPNPRGCKRSIVILRMHNNDYLGSTGIRFLQTYNKQLRQGGGKLMLSGVTEPVYDQLNRTGAINDFGADNIFCSNKIYFNSTTAAYQVATDELS